MFIVHPNLVNRNTYFTDLLHLCHSLRNMFSVLILILMNTIHTGFAQDISATICFNSADYKPDLDTGVNGKCSAVATKFGLTSASVNDNTNCLGNKKAITEMRKIKVRNYNSQNSRRCAQEIVEIGLVGILST